MIRLSNVGVAYRDLADMECVLANSGLDWMVVRPVTLVDHAATERSRVIRRYGLTDRISRCDVAEWILSALETERPFLVRTQMIGWTKRSS